MDYFDTKISNAIAGKFSKDVRKSVSILRRITGRDIVVPTSFVPLNRHLVEKWAKDLLHLKKLICELQDRSRLSPEEYLSLFNISSEGMQYLHRSGLKWASSFFRPDCILAPDGPKVLEFNIDPGSMAFIAGMAPKRFYERIPGFNQHLKENYGTTLDDSFWLESNFASHLRKLQLAGRKIHFWDISGRRGLQSEERTIELDYFRKSGVAVKLVEGHDIIKITSAENYVFRYFTYNHFLTPHPSLNKSYFRIPRDVLDSNDIAASSILYDNKINLAMLWDPRIQRHLDSHEIALVRKYIPKSYSSATIGNALSNRIRCNKTNWILKKGTGFQGKNTFAGQDYVDTDWAKQVETAKMGKGYIFQEVVSPVALPLELTDGAGSFIPKLGHVLNFYFASDTFAGLIFRVNRRSVDYKIGAIDATDVVAALPLLL